MASKETPLRAAPLHHAIVKPKGGGVGVGGGLNNSHPETFSGPEELRSQLDMEGTQRRKWSLLKKKIKIGKRGERAVTSILRPSTSVPWSFSLALSASALDSNVTKPKPCKQRRVKKRQGDAGGGGEGDCS